MRFIANGMLGGLGKTLRMLGINCTFFSGPEEKLIITARQEGRTVLTRNTKLRGKEGVIFIKGLKVIDQLRELDKKLSIREEFRPLSRCLICNVGIIPIEKVEVKDRVPYYTFLHFEKFYSCPICQRIYWDGSHKKQMEQRIKRIIDALD
ncbi:MAG TPA: hypothetical protein EYP24_01680 [bacterium (Candidatus Stahlbacteria)]|nr:hypothetical protein [Candidatus Stahlbacteria bacterium]